MKFVILNFVDAHGLKGAEADVEGDLGSFDTAIVNVGKDFGSEMEPGGGGGDGAAFAGIDGLVTIAIGGCVGAGDVGGKRDVANAIQYSEEVFGLLLGFAGPDAVGHRKADLAFAEGSAVDHFGLELIVVAEEKMLADADLAAGAHEAFPFIGIVAKLASKEDLDAPAQEVARGGIVRA